MGVFSLTIAVLSFALELHLLVRARHEQTVGRFPLFYSYIAFTLLWSVPSVIIYYATPRYYASWFWFCFLVTLLAEFAVLQEASDHIFDPFPSIRRLGRLITVSVGSAFLLLYILPALMRRGSSITAIFDLTKRTSVTKAIMIVVLLAAARLYRLPLGRNVAGLLLGFAAFQAINVANVSLVTRFVWSYAEIFAVVGPLSYVLALTIWNVALWRYEPVVPAPGELRGRVKGTAGTSGEQIARYDTELMRLFRR